MKAETGVQNKIMLALSDAGCTVWRNATSYCWVGKVIHKEGDQVTLKDAHPINAGLCPGSADIIGVTADGKFLAVEVKRQNKNSRAHTEQLNFIERVNQSGGIAGICRSVDDALELIRGEQ